MHLSDDSLSPDQRRREIASILARGLLRLRSAATTPGSVTSGRAIPAENDLELSATSRPHVTGG